MVKRVAFIVLLFSMLWRPSVAQNVKQLVDSLKFCTNDTAYTYSPVFWRIVKQGDSSLHYLIDKLTDTTNTSFKDSCKKANLNTGELAYFAMNQIGMVPVFYITHIQFDVFEDGCWDFYSWLFKNSNKAKFQQEVKRYYATAKFKWVELLYKNRSKAQKHYNIDKQYQVVE